MSYFLKKPITQEELNKWKNNKLINPRTNRIIKETGSVYKYILKQFNKNNKEYTLFDVSTNEEPITLDKFYEDKKIIVNQNEYIIYKENESNRINAFHYISVLGMLKNKITKHPITQNIIPEHVFISAKTIAKKFNYKENDDLSLEQLSLKAFQYFNSLSIFIDSNKFLELDQIKYKKLAWELSSFFDFNLTDEQKQQFKKNKFFKKFTKKDILDEIIYIMDNVSKTDKVFVSYLILGGLVIVMPDVKKEYPHLEFGF